MRVKKVQLLKNTDTDSVGLYPYECTTVNITDVMTELI